MRPRAISSSLALHRRRQIITHLHQALKRSFRRCVAAAARLQRYAIDINGVARGRRIVARLRLEGHAARHDLEQRRTVSRIKRHIVVGTIDDIDADDGGDVLQKRFALIESVARIAADRRLRLDLVIGFLELCKQPVQLVDLEEISLSARRRIACNSLEALFRELATSVAEVTAVAARAASLGLAA